ncbi:hypothetical protein ABPG74_002343 [Tetrahymena malaccensis]
MNSINRPQLVSQISQIKQQQSNVNQSQQIQHQYQAIPQSMQQKLQQKANIPNLQLDQQSQEQQKRMMRSISNLSINEQNLNNNSTQASSNMSFAALSERRHSLNNDYELFNQTIQQKRKFQEEIRKEIMCNVCYKISNQLYTSNCCQQYMCLDCNKKVQICTTCKKDYTLSKNVAALRLVYLLKQCICKHNDCRFVAEDIFKLQDHENNCEHKMLKCKECKNQLKDKDFLKHFMKEHEKVIKENYSEYLEDF